MEENNKADKKGMPGHPEGCYCWGCSGYGRSGHFRRFSLLRVLLGLLLLAVVFCLGVAIGTWHGRMHGFSQRSRGYYGRGPMMQPFMRQPALGYPPMMGTSASGTPPNMMYWYGTTTPPKK